jgi:hypothetical protein
MALSEVGQTLWTSWTIGSAFSRVPSLGLSTTLEASAKSGAPMSCRALWHRRSTSAPAPPSAHAGALPPDLAAADSRRLVKGDLAATINPLRSRQQRSSTLAMAIRVRWRKWNRMNASTL